MHVIFCALKTFASVSNVCFFVFWRVLPFAETMAYVVEDNSDGYIESATTLSDE